MPSTASRPKQRQLVRWNDDLDKSLLLFIAHTCSDMGIKIPYDEIAKRMGATFSEGAIQQHIAKLRAKMAQLNVAPVPGPPKRGQVTNKPSAVYGQKSRSGPPPQPAASARSRGRQLSNTLQPDGITPAPAGKSRPKRRATGRTIKRSASDVGNSDDELDDNGDLDYMNAPVNANGKRQRRASGRTANTGKKLNLARSGPTGIAAEVIRNLRQADQRFDQFGDNGVDNQPVTDRPAFLAGPMPPGHAHESAFAGTFGGAGPYNEPVEDEELEEEEELPQMARQAAMQNHNFTFDQAAQQSPYAQEEQISPRSTSNVSMHASQPQWPQFDGNGQGQFTFGAAPSFQMPAAGASQSGYFDPTTFGNFHHVSSHVGTPMAPSSAFPQPITSSSPAPFESQNASRNQSMYSQASSQGFQNGPQTPRPQHSGVEYGDQFLSNSPLPMQSYLGDGAGHFQNGNPYQNELENWHHLHSNNFAYPEHDHIDDMHNFGFIQEAASEDQ